ncbi:MAG: recombinase family protein, partial [[Ruminococcus] lactaris]|uniref:recombinase family protein n=1 Tax=[Ruminococcus] lactaris TaxID=46228 RepID=UPI00399C02F6
MARSVTVIPARNRQVSGYRAAPQKKIRVAAYCRVSTDQEDQLHSFEAQVDYYTKHINDHENYEMAGIYADEGISGTNTKKREQFKRMIADCGKGKIDLVITKSISRFARNTQDCLMYSRKLKNLGIGIIFEKENINTLDSTGELLFTILSSLAQDESRNISENCKWGIRTKFKNGEMHLNTFKFLGYDKDENGKLIINREQAKTVRRIYRDFLWGLNPAQIAKELEDEQVPGCLGQTKWYASTVIGILKQEKHMGDALLQKTYTADFLTKRQVQ